MLFKADVLEGIVAGLITCAFRRWRRPTVREGTALRTPAGLVRIGSVLPIAPGEVTDADARRAGFPDAASLLGDLPGREGDTLYRVELCFAGADPRVALREQADLTDDEVRVLGARLARLDRASPRGPWTTAALDAIAAEPGRPAGQLAASAGLERTVFKRNVRKLKELGLTISLTSGYRLSPRGEELRRRMGRGERS